MSFSSFDSTMPCGLDVCATLVDNVPFWLDGLKAIETRLERRYAEHDAELDTSFEIIHLDNGELQKVVTPSPTASFTGDFAGPTHLARTRSPKYNPYSKSKPERKVPIIYDSEAQHFLGYVYDSISTSRSMIRNMNGHNLSTTPPLDESNPYDDADMTEEDEDEEEDELDMAELLASIRKKPSAKSLDGFDATMIHIDNKLKTLQDNVANIALDLLRQGHCLLEIDEAIKELESVRTMAIREECRRDSGAVLSY